MKTERRLQIRIALGYIAMLTVGIGMAFILVHERHRMYEIESDTREIRQIRICINKMQHHITELAISGESVIDWDESEYQKYQARRLFIDSLLQDMKSLCANYVQPRQIDTLRSLLADKELHLKHIMNVFLRLEAADSLLVNHLPEVAKRATRVRTVQQRERKLKCVK